MMNSDFMLIQSDIFAHRIVKEAGADTKAQIQFAWELAFSQVPTEQETAQALAFLEQQKEQLKVSPEAAKLLKADKSNTPEHLALASFCQTLVSSNRFLYVD
jgi:hypothetical protein